MTGVYGPNPSDHYSVKGGSLSRCPYINTLLDYLALDSSIIIKTAGVRFYSFNILIYAF